MVEKARRSFIVLELDPDLLPAPSGVQTEWHVITGAPSCGKTTLIQQLAKEGFLTVAETARQHFEGEVAKGQTIDDIRANPAALERDLIDLQRRTEDDLPPLRVIFLDRALPDSLTFCRIAGLNPNEYLGDCCPYRYASVFILDRLPFQWDGTRTDDDAAIAGLLDEWHARDYSALGYSVVRVPVLPPEERLAFVLDSIQAKVNER